MLKRQASRLNILTMTRREHHVQPTDGTCTYEYSPPPTSPLPKIPMLKNMINNVIKKSSSNNKKIDVLNQENVVSSRKGKLQCHSEFNSLHRELSIPLTPTQIPTPTSTQIQTPTPTHTNTLYSRDSTLESPISSKFFNFYNEDNSVYSVDNTDIDNLHDSSESSVHIQTNSIASTLLCVLCNNTPTNTTNCGSSGGGIVLLECMHCVHVDCFVNKILNTQPTFVCTCSKNIDTDDIKSIFNKYLKTSKIQNDTRMSEISTINSNINNMTSIVKDLYVEYDKIQTQDKKIKDYFINLVV
jgi:hypothetical protein